MKRYNSVVQIAITVDHDDKEQPTADELREALRRRYMDLMYTPNDELLEAFTEPDDTVANQ